MKDWWNSLETKTKVIVGVIGVFVVVGAIGAALGVKPAENTTTSTMTTTTPAPESNTEADGSLKIAANGVSREDYATKCQDEITVKNVLSKDITLISILSYNERMNDVGYRDKGGNQILMVQWNGKNKKTDELVTFTCYIGGADKDSLTVEYATINTSYLLGIEKFEAYNKDGDRIDWDK